jgi:chromosome partitioning protein
MGATVVAFFNNKGGVGKSTLVYHLAHMYAELGKVVLAADLDPQANLTAAFLNDGALEQLWANPHARATVSGMLAPLMEGTGDIAPTAGQTVGRNLVLLPGDLELSNLEDELSNAWPRCLEGATNPRAFRVMSAFGRLLRKVAERHAADIVLVDVGPNLGAINRAALVASDFVVVPLGPDLFSVQGLRNLGPALRHWREGWRDRLARSPASVPGLPMGTMIPLGYVMLTQSGRGEKPTRSHQRWLARVPEVYADEVLGLTGVTTAGDLSTDRRCLAQIQHYRSLMPMAQEVRRPIFQLRHVDGAIGAHQQTVRTAWNDFSALAMRLARGMSAPDGDVAGLLGDVYRPAPRPAVEPVRARALPAGSGSVGQAQLGPGHSAAGTTPAGHTPAGHTATGRGAPGYTAPGYTAAEAGGPVHVGPVHAAPDPADPRAVGPGRTAGAAQIAAAPADAGRDQPTPPVAAPWRDREQPRGRGRSRVIEYPVRPDRNPWQNRPAGEGWPASAAARY